MRCADGCLYSLQRCNWTPTNCARDSSRCFERISRNLASSAPRFRFGKTENRSSIFTADFATRAANNRGRTIRIVLIWSATKGLGSACLLHVLQEHKIDIERAGRGVLAGVCASRQRKDHACAIAFASGRTGCLGCNSRHARLRRGYRRARETGTDLATGNRAWLSRAHLRVSCSMNWSGELPGRRSASIGEKSLPNRSISISGSVCRKRKTRESRRCTRRKRGKAARATTVLSRPGHAWNLRAQSLHFAPWFERSERNEQTGDPRAADRFLWRNRQREFAGEILRDAGEWWRTRRSEFFSEKTIELDDDNADATESIACFKFRPRSRPGS